MFLSVFHFSWIQVNEGPRREFGDRGHWLPTPQRKLHKPLGGGGSVAEIRCVRFVDQQTSSITTRVSNLETCFGHVWMSSECFTQDISEEDIEVKSRIFKYILQSVIYAFDMP